MTRYPSLLGILTLCLALLQGGQSLGYSNDDERQSQGGLLRGRVENSSTNHDNVIVVNSVDEDEWERNIEVQGDRELQDVTTRLYIFQCFFTFTGGTSVPDADDFSEMVRRTQILYNRQVGSNYGQNFRSVTTAIKSDNGDFTSATDTEYRIQFTTDVVIKNIAPVPSQSDILSLLLNFDRTLYLTNFADMIL